MATNDPTVKKGETTKMITNCMRRQFHLPAAPGAGVTMPAAIPAGDTVPVSAEYWEHVWAGGKNKVLAALVSGDHLRVRTPEEAQKQGSDFALRNPASPHTPDQLLDTPEGVQPTKTRSRSAPKVLVQSVDG